MKFEDFIMTWGVCSCIVLCLLTSGIIVYFALTNGNIQGINLVKPILAGAIVSVYMLITLYLPPLEKHTDKTTLHLICEENGKLITLTKIMNPKYSSYMYEGYHQLNYSEQNYAQQHPFEIIQKDSTNLSLLKWDGSKKTYDSINAAHKRLKEYYFDLVEWTTFVWISQQYPGHWQIERNEYHGLSAGGKSIYTCNNADKDVNSINIAKILEGNRFADFNKNDSRKVVFPKGSSVTIRRTDFLRNIEIKTPYIVMNIRLSCETVGGSISRSSLGRSILSKSGIATDALELFMNVEFNISPRLWTRWTSTTKEQIKWGSGMSTLYKKYFDWETINHNLSDSINSKD